jgi:hypothetical protein
MPNFTELSFPPIKLSDSIVSSIGATRSSTSDSSILLTK